MMRRTSRRRVIHTLESLEWRRMLTVSIDGVQPIALQTPHVNVLLRRTVNGTPLGSPGFDFGALFDTASPGLVLSNETSDALGVAREQASGDDALITHDHAQGSIGLNISEPLYFGLASDHPEVDPTDPASYTTNPNPQFMETGPVPAQGVLSSFDVFGLGATAGKVVVMDPKPANRFDDTIRTFVYPPGTPFTDNESDPGIPTVSRHVKLSYADYSRFTSNASGAANVPNLHKLAFVGPNPIEPDATSPAVGFNFNGSNNSGSFLLATGASTSMISLAKAAALGVTYQAGTFGTSNPRLVLPSGSQQFQTTVQSFAGPVTLAGLYLDTLTLSTTENDPMQFNHVPVLVGDLSLGALASPSHVSLDGVLGMNLFVASAAPLTATTVDHQTQNAFNWIVLDEANKTLGLDVESLGQHPRVLSSSFNYQGTGAPSVSFQFSSDVVDTPDPSFFELTNQSTGQTINTPVQLDYNAATHVATFTFTAFPQGLPDANYTARVLNGVVADTNGASIGRDYTMAFFSFEGDANYDRTVNALDFNAVASNFGASNRGFAGGDFDLNGVTNTADFTLLAGRFNHFFDGPAQPSVLFAPGGAIAPPSGLAAPAPLPASLFSDLTIADSDPANALTGLLD
jgi:hypothetical protein